MRTNFFGEKHCESREEVDAALAGESYTRADVYACNLLDEDAGSKASADVLTIHGADLVCRVERETLEEVRAVLAELVGLEVQE